MNHPQLPQAPPGAAGRARLYLPHRLFAGQPASFQANDSPVAAGHPALPMFPIPFPVGLPVQNPLSLHMHPLQKAPHTTSRKSLTKTAAQITALQNSANRMNRVQVCRSFWDNLIRYASHPVAQPGGPAPPPNTTWTIPPAQRIPLSSADQQVEGIKALAAWYIYHVNRVPVIPQMSSEPSVQGEFLIQAIEPVNGLLKIRYPSLGVVNDDAAYPRWTRSCDALHRTPGVQINAGDPDFMLLRSSGLQENGAIMEIKCWWAYLTEDLEELFDVIVSPDGTISNVGSSSAKKLLLQIWGELHFYQSYLGCFTNGETVMFFARSGPNTLILSPLRPWNHQDVHAALAGLSYAGVDIRHLGQATVVDQLLCPQADWASHW